MLSAITPSFDTLTTLGPYECFNVLDPHAYTVVIHGHKATEILQEDAKMTINNKRCYAQYKNTIFPTYHIHGAVPPPYMHLPETSVEKFFQTSVKIKEAPEYDALIQYAHLKSFFDKCFDENEETNLQYGPINHISGHIVTFSKENVCHLHYDHHLTSEATFDLVVTHRQSVISERTTSKFSIFPSAVQLLGKAVGKKHATNAHKSHVSSHSDVENTTVNKPRVYKPLSQQHTFSDDVYPTTSALYLPSAPRVKLFEKELKELTRKFFRVLPFWFSTHDGRSARSFLHEHDLEGGEAQYTVEVSLAPTQENVKLKFRHETMSYSKITDEDDKIIIDPPPRWLPVTEALFAFHPPDKVAATLNLTIHQETSQYDGSVYCDTWSKHGELRLRTRRGDLYASGPDPGSWRDIVDYVAEDWCPPTTKNCKLQIEPEGFKKLRSKESMAQWVLREKEVRERNGMLLEKYAVKAEKENGKAATVETFSPTIGDDIVEPDDNSRAWGVRHVGVVMVVGLIIFVSLYCMVWAYREIGFGRKKNVITGDTTPLATT